MGIGIQMGDYPFQAIDYGVDESSTPLAGNDTSGAVGGFDFTIPPCDEDLRGGFSGFGPGAEESRNLPLNPSFEAVSAGTTTIRQNLVNNPRLTVNATGWGATGSTATTARVAVADPFLPAGTGWAHQRAGTDFASGTRNYVGIPNLVIGELYTASFYANVTVADPLAANWRANVSTDTNNTNAIFGTYVTPNAGWQRVNVTFTALATTVYLHLRQAGPAAGAASMTITAALVEQGDGVVKPFFDGGTTNAKGWVTTWSGTANNSISNAQALGVEVYRNMWYDPRATDYVPSYWSFGGAAGALSNITNVTPDMPTGIRWTRAATGAARFFEIRQGLSMPALGADISVRLTLRSSINMSVAIQIRPNATSTADALLLANVSLVANVPQEYTYSGPSIAVASQSSSAIVVSGGVGAIGDTIDVTKVLISNSLIMPPYMDGIRSGDPDLFTVWTGTANGSASVAYGAQVATVSGNAAIAAITSWQAKVNGDVSQRNVKLPGTSSSAFTLATGFSVVSGQTYTASLWMRSNLNATVSSIIIQNTAGTTAVATIVPSGTSVTTSWVEYRVTFVAPVTTACRLVLRGHSSTTVNFYYDAFMLVPGEFAGPYWDGDTVSSSDTIMYTWDGTPHGSQSVRSVRVPQFNAFRDTGWAKIKKYGPDYFVGAPVRLTDTRKGFTVGSVESYREGNDGSINFICTSRLGELNIYGVQAQPFVGTLEGAFEYYLSLASVDTDYFVDPAVASRPVTYPGWTGELWYNLKLIAAAQDCDIDLVSGIVLLRSIREREAAKGRATTRSQNLPSPQLARAVEVWRHDNRAITNKLVYPPTGWVPGTEIITANAGETITQTLQLSASVTSVAQPVMMSSVSDTFSASSVYTIIGDDDTIIDPLTWGRAGGYVRVEINPDTQSLNLTLGTPGTLVKSDGNPYRTFSIAQAAGQNGARYSTLRIIGTGVAFTRTKERVRTTVPENVTATDVGVTIDNPYVSTFEDVARVGVRAAMRYAGQQMEISANVISINRRGESGDATYPTYAAVETALKLTLGPTATYGQVQTYYTTTLALTTYGDVQNYWFLQVRDEFANQAFGNVAGARVRDRKTRRWYRIRSAGLDLANIDVTAEDDLTHGDVQEFYQGKTYAQVQAIFGGFDYKRAWLLGLLED